MTAFELQIRPGDCDAFGHVNNAVYFSWMEQVLAARLADLAYLEDWQREGAFSWRLRRAAAEYRQPARFGDRLQARLWLSESDPIKPAFGFEIQRLEAEQDPAIGFRGASNLLRTCYLADLVSAPGSGQVPEIPNLCERPSTLPNYSLAKQVIVGPPIDHAFHEFQTVDVALGGPIRPIMDQRRPNSLIVLFETRREITPAGDLAVLGLPQPLLEISRLPSSHHGGK